MPAQCKSRSVHFRDPTPNATSFPEIIGVGSTFDPDLFKAMGMVIGTEARVMMNVGNAGGDFWAPVSCQLARERDWSSR